MNLKDKKRQIFFSNSGGGVGCVCAHPSQKYFAVGEKGYFPCIFIYSYPEIKLYRILCKGTEHSYSIISFSGNGEQLVSVGGSPDYQITVWNWKN